MITAHHDMATTIRAMKAGAFDYIHKPIDEPAAFDVAVDRALEVRQLSRAGRLRSVARPRRATWATSSAPAPVDAAAGEGDRQGGGLPRAPC